MEEKKLTDEEIVKAYEHCYVNDGTCKSCCLTDEDKLCVSHEDVLDLIQRQKAEIEWLTEERENMQAVIFALEEEKRQAVKDTAVVVAKEILQPLYDEATCNVSETVELTTFQIEQYAEYYGVVLE